MTEAFRVGTGGLGCVKDADGSVIAGTCSSDQRLKQDVTPFTHSLETVARLQPVSFAWRADEFPERHFGSTRSFGLIAQDVEAVLPELVTTDADGYKAVKYSQLPFYMLQAIKDLKAENDRLKSESDRLKSETDLLKQQLTMQESGSSGWNRLHADRHVRGRQAPSAPETRRPQRSRPPVRPGCPTR